MTFGELFNFEKVGSFKVTSGSVHRSPGVAYSREVWFPGVCSSRGVWFPGGAYSRRVDFLGVCSSQGSQIFQLYTQQMGSKILVWFSVGAYSRGCWLAGSMLLLGSRSPGGAYSRGVWFPVGANFRGVWIPGGAHSRGVSSNLNNFEDLKVNSKKI